MPFRGGQPGSRNRPSLSFNLDSKVLDHVRAVTHSQADSSRPLAVSELYHVLQERDVQLRRLKKVALEASISRALAVVRSEIVVLDSDEEILSNTEDGEVKDSNFMNEFVTSQWKSNQSLVPSGNQTPRNEANGDSQTASLPVESNVKRKASSTTLLPKRRKNIQNDWSAPTNVSLKDVGGIEGPLSHDLMEYIAYPLLRPDVYVQTGIRPPRGVLLYGPPGCGKTLLANALAGELGLPFISLSATAIVSGVSGESEKKIRDVFEEAKSNAPCLIFIDEIDVITQRRENAQRDMERRMVAQLSTCMDDLSLDKTDGKVVIVIGATNRPETLDPALRRAGRFDREICMNVPDDKARESILRIICRQMKTAPDLDFGLLAKMTPGFVGADLQALATTAGVVTVRRISKIDEIARQLDDEMDTDQPHPSTEQLPSLSIAVVEAWISQTRKNPPPPMTTDEEQSIYITQEDFLAALPRIQPSAKREGFATVPDVTWDNIGALSELRRALQLAIVEQIQDPERYSSVGITAPSGVLLWGPPGCGKTLLAKAVANQSRANFISVKGPELLNKYLGESERAVRQVFQRARASAPCIIFFDELDALVPKRRDDAMSEASSRVVNALLTELDGVVDRKGVYVIGATNRPDIIDPAMIRPGRLDHPLFVGLPTSEGRLEILQTLTKNTPLAADVDLKEIAFDNSARNFSGADLSFVVRQAAIAALNEMLVAKEHGDPVAEADGIKVSMAHFKQALETVRPSVSDQDRARYEHLKTVFEV